MSLALFTPVFEWVEQFRIKTCQACQVPKASISSVLRLLEKMSRVLRGLATRTSWPHSCSSTRLTHGE